MKPSTPYPTRSIPSGQLADAAGAVIQARNYDPFGNPDGSLGSLAT
ncbi:MAG: hypothetical protein WCE68_08405 [Anaerolineales bacterium]